jgi:hypothetical protein
VIRPAWKLTVLLAATLLTGAAKPKRSTKKHAPPPPPPGPAWAGQAPRYVRDAAGRGFVAVGRTDDPKHPEAAEDDARQKLGQLIAAWQEKTLACARQASEAKVTATSQQKKGLSMDITVETATTVSLYDEQVAEHGTQGSASLVLMRQDLGKMMTGIEYDASRSQGMRDAVKGCGEKTFDALAGS